MNRRQKIIVSVTGIFLVLLVLVGLTYAFFLTRIKGNENPKSISVTTANLRLIYDDGSDGVIGGVNLTPSDEIYEKQFTVYNDGNVNTTYGLYLINVVNTFERKEDIEYTLGCTTDGEIECGGNGITTFPSGNYRMVENTIEPGKTHTYTFRFTYKETGTDQSVDMGKELSAKIQIFGKDGEFEYIPYDEETLAYSIVRNAKSTTLEQSQTLGYAYYSETPLTTPAEVESGENESTLSLTTDDYGNSYYFRGNVKNNYVNFAGMCWRAVRIEGDGSVKLILEDRNEQCNDEEGNDLNNNETYFTGNWGDENIILFGYDSNLRADFINYEGDVIGLANSLQTFQRLLAQKINDNITTLSSQAEINNTLATKLKVEEWCYDNKLTETEIDGDGYYGAYTRIKTNKTPSLQCTGTKLTRFKDNSDMFTGALTADEIIFAGATFSPNLNYYLINSYVKENDIMEWYSLSLYKFYSYPDYDIYDGEDQVFKLDTDGSLSYDPVNNDRDAQSRPAVTLKAGTVITDGTGIIGDPYEIKMN